MTTAEIQQRIKNAKDLDFGTLFSQSVELFKKTWVQGLVSLLLNIVLAIPIVLVVYIPALIFGFADAYMNANSYDAYGTYAQSSQPQLSAIATVMGIVLYLFFLVAMSAIGVGIRAGFYRICKLKDLDQMGREDYFYFFKKPYLGKTIQIGLVYAGISIVAAMLCVVPIIYAIVPLSYMFLIYAFHPDKSVSEIVKLSFDLGNRKWLLTFGLLFVSGILAGIVGMLMCFVGIYITMSFTFLPTYLIYKEVIGFEDDEIDQIQRIERLSTL